MNLLQSIELTWSSLAELHTCVAHVHQFSELAQNLLALYKCSESGLWRQHLFLFLANAGCMSPVSWRTARNHRSLVGLTFGVMNPIQAIATLRKFANYLVGIFPFLAAIGDWLYGLLRKLGELPLLKPLTTFVGQSSAAQAIWKFFERFYWRDYAKDRMELGAAPAETTPVLRTMIQMCVVLSAVIPLAQWQGAPFFAPIAIETSSGYQHVMASWPVLLWILCLPCAWASLLIGTAVCNRIAFSATAVGALYFLSGCILFLPRSYFNALLTIPILFALFFNLSTLHVDRRRAKIMQLLTALIVGAAAGFQFTILTPLRPWLGSVLPASWNGPAIGIGAGCTIGVYAGLLCLVLSKLFRARQTDSPDSKISIKSATFMVSVLLIAFLSATALRGGLAPLGGAIISVLDTSNAYLADYVFRWCRHH